MDAPGGTEHSDTDPQSLLLRFHVGVVELLEEYAAILQLIVSHSRDQLGVRIDLRVEAQISERIRRFAQQSGDPMLKSAPMLEFFAMLRARSSLDPCTYDGLSCESAHAIALLAYERLHQSWNICLRAAHRSRTELGMLYVTTAPRVYTQQRVTAQTRPQTLLAMLEVECRAALLELDRITEQASRSAASAQMADHVTITGNTVQVAGGTGAAAPATAAPAISRPERFPTPAGAGWKDLLIRFSDGETVLARIGEVHRTLNYTQMGMNDGRNAKPNQQWQLLRAFASSGGTLTWDHPFADNKNQKRKELLAAGLRSFFGIPDEPFENIPGGWQAKFKIEPDA